MTYSVRDEASSLDTGRLDSLEEVDHTFGLESLQLRMETDERSRPSHSVTEEKQFSSWLAIECVLGGLLFIVQLDQESHNRYRCVCQPL